MRYQKVKWIHQEGEHTEPIWLYSEIDENNKEIRKVDQFEDGRLQFADQNKQTGDTHLSIEPMPDLDEINSQKQFQGAEMTKEDFEKVWEKAVQ